MDFTKAVFEMCKDATGIIEKFNKNLETDLK